MRTGVLGPPERCPRCTGMVLRDGDDPYCLPCGWRETRDTNPDDYMRRFADSIMEQRYVERG